jgi:hypothetical protein
MLETLASTLQVMLHADIVHARLGVQHEGFATVSATHIEPGADTAALDRALEFAVREWEAATRGGVTRLMPHHHTAGQVRFVVWPLGADASVLVVGTRRGDFPTEQKYLLQRVAASQGGIALASARLLAASDAARAAAEKALASVIDAPPERGSANKQARVLTQRKWIRRC